MTEPEKHAGELDLLGGRVSLDFANTVDWHASDDPIEYLHTYGDLVAWSLHAGVLAGPEAESLLAEAARRPGEAAAALLRAVQLREVIYRIFSALARDRALQQSDLAAFNAELSAALAHSAITLADEGFAWIWEGDEGALDRLLWPVVRDAVDLMTSAELSRVGQCADDQCGWLFLDLSRNRSRRWCSMKDCGNRAKARRHYRRLRRARRPAG